MAGYIGQDVAEHFSEFQKQDLTGATGGTLTLSSSVNNANDIELYINHVRQEPTTSYSASGTTITLNGYTVAASDDIYVMYKKAIITHAPSSGSVGAGQIANGSVTGDKLSANLDLQNVTIKGGSNTAMTIDSTGRILTPARPAFRARMSDGTGSTGVNGTLVFETEDFDIGGNYNTSNGRFTAPITGIYWFSFDSLTATDTSGFSNATTDVAYVDFQKNGTSIEGSRSYAYHVGGNWQTSLVRTDILSLSANDYIEVKFISEHAYFDDNNSFDPVFQGYLIG